MEIPKEKFKDILCDSCRFAKLTIREYYKPIFATSSLVIKVKRLQVECFAHSESGKFVNRMMTFKQVQKQNCGYRPKAGKIGKNIKQETLM